MRDDKSNSLLWILAVVGAVAAVAAIAYAVYRYMTPSYLDDAEEDDFFDDFDDDFEGLDLSESSKSTL